MSDQGRADALSASHEGSATQRNLVLDHDLVGQIGERHFGEVFGLPLGPIHLSGKNDDHKDFEIAGHKVDIKTSRKPYNLLVEEGKCEGRTIYVHVGLNGSVPTLLGWQWGKRLLQSTPKPFNTPYNCHYMPVRQLRPISELMEQHNKSLADRK